jgi:FAD synthase
MPCALSIGWNPVFDNSTKTIEVFIIEDFGPEDFYGQSFSVKLTRLIRGEALFDDFDSLILAI